MPFSEYGFCFAALARKLQHEDELIMINESGCIEGASEKITNELFIPNTSKNNGSLIKISDICKNFTE